MIYFVSTASHNRTHRAVSKVAGAFARTTYPQLLARSSLPRATYIFSDFDRLSVWQIEVAAHVYRSLRDGGCRVLNDPAQALQRLALLRQLRHDGVNSFGAWPAVEVGAVDRFPAFLRTATAHRGNLTDPLPDATALTAALERLIEDGYPLANLIAVEYRAEPLQGDVFRKLAMYRIGDRMTPAPSVHERHWTAKYGENGVAGEAAYEDDLEQVRALPHAPIVRRAFEAAHIDYGRADYGLVGGRPEIYEINTNPMIDRPKRRHPFATRDEAVRFCREAYFSAVTALDTTEAGGPIKIKRPDLLTSRRWRERILPGYGWTP
jgi:hypothetical protein